jgi:hypothetical protein
MSNQHKPAGGIGGGLIFFICIMTLINIVIGLSEFIWFVRNPSQYVRSLGAGVVEGFSDIGHSNKLLSFTFVLAVLAIVVINSCMIAVMVLHALLSRRWHPVVFISHKHAKMGHLIEGITKAFESGGLVASYVPFRPDADHDRIIDDVEDRIKNSDVVVCLPGDEPSWVEIEVASAGAQRKPLILLLPRENNGAPDSASRQYPALILDTLIAMEYRPLVDLIGYIHGSTPWTWKLIRMMTAPGEWFGVIMIAMCVTAVVILGSTLVYMLGQWLGCIFDFACHAHMRGYVLGRMTYVGLVVAGPALLALAVAGPLRALFNRMKAVRLVRRQIRIGKYSYGSLKALFEQTNGLKPLLDVFWIEAPKAHHETR